MDGAFDTSIIMEIVNNQGITDWKMLHDKCQSFNASTGIRISEHANEMKTERDDVIHLRKQNGLFATATLTFYGAKLALTEQWPPLHDNLSDSIKKCFDAGCLMQRAIEFASMADIDKDIHDQFRDAELTSKIVHQMGRHKREVAPALQVTQGLFEHEAGYYIQAHGLDSNTFEHIFRAIYPAVREDTMDEMKSLFAVPGQPNDPAPGAASQPKHP